MENKAKIKEMISKIEKDFEITNPRFLKLDGVKMNFGIMVLSSILTARFAQECNILIKNFNNNVIETMLRNMIGLTRDLPYSFDVDNLLKDIKDMAEDNKSLGEFFNWLTIEGIRNGSDFTNYAVVSEFSKDRMSNYFEKHMSRYLTKTSMAKMSSEELKLLELGLIKFGRLITVEEINKYIDESGIIGSYADTVESILDNVQARTENDNYGSYFSLLRGQDHVGGIIEMVRYFNIAVLAEILTELGEEEMVNYNIDLKSYFYKYTAGNGYKDVLDARVENNVNIVSLKDKGHDLEYKGDPAVELRTGSSYYQNDDSWRFGEIALCVAGGLIGLYGGALLFNAVRNPDFNFGDVVDYTNNSILDVFGLGYNKVI